MILPNPIFMWEPGRGYVRFWPAIGTGNRIVLRSDQLCMPETMDRAVAAFREAAIGSVTERRENAPGVKP